MRKVFQNSHFFEKYCFFEHFSHKLKKKLLQTMEYYANFRFRIYSMVLILKNCKFIYFPWFFHKISQKYFHNIWKVVIHGYFSAENLLACLSSLSKSYSMVFSCQIFHSMVFSKVFQNFISKVFQNSRTLNKAKDLIKRH